MRAGAFGVLVLLGCGGPDDDLEGVTDECILQPIVEARLARGAVDCSPELDGEQGPVPLFVIAERGEDPAAVECIGAALAAGSDAVYLSELIAATDSFVQSAKFVNADGTSMQLTYDSSPSGQGSGSNTVVLHACAPFHEAPGLGCEDARFRQLVCSQDEAVRRSYR